MLASTLAVAMAVGVAIGVASGVTYCEINWSVERALVRSTKGSSVLCSCETRWIFLKHSELRNRGLLGCLCNGTSLEDSISLTGLGLDASLRARLAGRIFRDAALLGRHEV
jgi:hypothetical protein